LFIHVGISGGRDVANGIKGQGTEVTEGCSRVMKDQVKMDGGEMETTERPTNQELHHETHK
jgi:hypothetical protein